MAVKEDDSKTYKLANGKNCAKFVQILLGEDQPWVKIINISDRMMAEAEFNKFVYWRRHFKQTPVNNEIVYLKEEAIKKAKNYIYKAGEAAEISNRKFEKALKTGDLSGFPNVLFF